MPLYRLTKNYGNKRLGPWLAGDVVDLAGEHAQRIENEAPGTLEPWGRIIEAPPHDRMIRTPQGKRSEE
jgi:hypothetical protein